MVSSAEPNLTPPAGPILRILLVEDHEDTADIAAALLRMLEFEVRVAGSVSTALEAAASRRFDLLISDIELPDGSGLDLPRMLSERFQAPIKGIAMSGYGLDPALVQQAGFLEHLKKPVDLPALLAAIRKVAG